jgi:hypothetical protein
MNVIKKQKKIPVPAAVIACLYFLS